MCEEKVAKLLSIIERVANKEYERDNWRGILDSVAELFDADGAGIAEVKGDYVYYTRVSGSIVKFLPDYDPEECKVPVKGSAFEEALKEGYFIVNDYQNYPKAVPIWKKMGLKTKLIAILGKEQPLGSLAVGRFFSSEPFHEEDGKILRNLAFIFSLIVKEEMEKQKLLEKAIRDHLTKLYNRLYLEEEIPKEIERARRYAYPVSLILFDLDGFKEINDSYGHRMGDEVLVRFSEVLRRRIRTTDIPVRYGGEEFIVVLPHTYGEEAYKVAERVREDFQKVTMEVNKNVLMLTVSAGVATMEGSDMTLEDLINMADRAMYRAKKLGKNRVEVYTPEMA